jgi:hypothetical protein
MATLITPQNYKVDNLPIGSIENLPASVRQMNEIVTELNSAGSFYNSTTITTAAINTAYQVPTPTTVYTEGMVYSSNTILLLKAGTYSFDFTIQVFKNNTSAEGSLTAWLAVNGTNQDYTANTISLAISNQIGVLTLHSHVVITEPLTRVGLLYAANSTDMQLRASIASGVYPAIAGVTLEVNKIR